MSNKRTHARYILRDKGRIVKFGITGHSIPEKRIAENRDAGFRFTSWTILERVSLSSARKWETSSCERHAKSHGGRWPRYNRKPGKKATSRDRMARKGKASLRRRKAGAGSDKQKKIRSAAKRCAWTGSCEALGPGRSRRAR